MTPHVPRPPLVSLLFLIAACAALTAPAAAGVIRVPADQPTLAAAIAAAAAGDTVLVAPGTYSGPDNRDLDFTGKDLVLRSEAGAETTIIGAPARRAVSTRARRTPPSSTASPS
jgi:polygalacturonase